MAFIIAPAAVQSTTFQKSAPMAQRASIVGSGEGDGPLSNRHYFAGIDNSWSLVASTARNPRVLIEDCAVETYSLKHISPIGPHAIVVLWDALAHAITPLNTSNAWVWLNCFRIGHSANAPVVVLLHVKAGVVSTADGEALAARILLKYQDLLRQYSLRRQSTHVSSFSTAPANSASMVPTELTVEIAEILPCCASGGDDPLSNGPPYSENAQSAHPGCSIGYHCSGSTGSIAAFFEATLRSGEATKFLLTNHHVVSPNSDKPFPPQWDSERSHDVFSPSPEDLKIIYERTKEIITGLKSVVDRIEARDKSELAVETIQELDGKKNSIQADIEHYENMLPTLSQENTKWAIASVAETSGLRSDQDGNQMEWGVATLIKGISSPNRLPKWDLPKEGFATQAKLLTVKVEENFPIPFPSSLTTISDVPLQATDLVVKYGRTTRWTLGVVNECGSFHYNWHAKGEVSKSFSIVGYNGVPFSKPGDSGSMILNTRGEAAAVLFANDRHSLTFAADIRATLADIELRTPLRDIQLLR